MNRLTLPETLSPSPATAQAQRASVAIGLAPLLVLVAFVAVVGGLIEPDIGVAVFAACTAWVVYEMYRYQSRLDSEVEEAASPGAGHSRLFP